MKRWRIVLVVALATLLIAGHAYDVIAQREHWPFSYYPMYGRVQKRRELRILTLYMRTPDEKSKRPKLIKVVGTPVPPFGETGIRNILMTAWGSDGSAPDASTKTENVLREFQKMYEVRRRHGSNDGPQMLEAVLCRETFPIDADENAPPRRIEELVGVKRDGTVVEYQRLHASPSTRGEVGRGAL